MVKRIFALLLVVVLLTTVLPTATAADVTAEEAARQLYGLGLMQGTGTDEYGNPIFELDRTPTRHEAVTMLIRLLGMETIAINNSWTIPFNDVAKWAAPYVGYAYHNSLTDGISATKYGGDMTTTAAHYITFVLRALGYKSGIDFQWNMAWEKSDTLGLTNGEYTAHSNFTRGDVALISYRALNQYVVGTGITLKEMLIKTNLLSTGDNSTENAVTENIPVRSITIECENGFVGPGEEIVLRANVSPSNATSELVWETDRPECTSVDDGVVRMFAEGSGSAKITVTSSNGVSAYIYVFLTRSKNKADVKDAEGLRYYLQKKYTNLVTPVGNLLLRLTMNISQEYPDEPLFAHVSVDFTGEDFAPNTNSLGYAQKVTPLNFTGVGYSREEEALAYEMIRELQRNIYQDIVDCFPSAQASGNIKVSGYHYPNIQAGYWSNQTLTWNNYNGTFEWVPSADSFDLLT